jgi:hypothetical protein
VVLVSQALEAALSIFIPRRSGQATTAQRKEEDAIKKEVRLELSCLGSSKFCLDAAQMIQRKQGNLFDKEHKRMTQDVLQPGNMENQYSDFTIPLFRLDSEVELSSSLPYKDNHVKIQQSEMADIKVEMVHQQLCLYGSNLSKERRHALHSCEQADKVDSP